MYTDEYVCIYVCVYMAWPKFQNVSEEGQKLPENIKLNKSN